MPLREDCDANIWNFSSRRSSSRASFFETRRNLLVDQRFAAAEIEAFKLIAWKIFFKKAALLKKQTHKRSPKPKKKKV